MEQPTVFQFFKKKTSPALKLAGSIPFYFQLNIDDYGGYLETTDENGSPIQVNSLNYEGQIRTTLRLIDQILERNSFIIDWEKPQDRIYLNDHLHLIEYLKHCDNLVDQYLKPLKIDAEEAQIGIHLSYLSGPKQYQSQVKVQFHGHWRADFQMVTSEHILFDQQIVPISEMGPNFSGLDHFNTLISEGDLALFLSLLFSNLEAVKLHFPPYQIEHTEEVLAAKPAIFFEKIDEDQALFLRLGQTLPDLDLQALNQFEISKFAEVNELEEKIRIKYVDRVPLSHIREQLVKRIKKYFPPKKEAPHLDLVIEEDLLIIPMEVITDFLYQELSELLLQFEIYGAEQLKSYQVSTKQPEIQLRLRHSIDYFEGDVYLDFSGELMNLFDVLKQYEKQRYVKLADGTNALLNEVFIRKLERLFEKRQGKAALSFFDLPFVEEAIGAKISGEMFKQGRQFFEKMNELDKTPFDYPPVKATLRPYQEQGVKWLRYLHEHNLGGCLADDMGLGKTLQSISLLADTTKESQPPSLIVMPRSLLLNWERELARFAPQLNTTVYYGTSRDLSEAVKHDLILTTYAIVRNDIELLQGLKFFYIILDESQNIKNINSQTTKAMMLLQAEHRLALSGTPIENNLSELYSLFRFLNPTMFGTLRKFNDQFMAPIQKYRDKAAMQHLRKKIYPFVLRRLKQDVLDDLPDKTEQILYVEMSSAQKKLYEERRQFYKQAIQQEIAEKGLQQSRFFVFQAMSELRQIASMPSKFSDQNIPSAKLETLTEHLFEAISNGHKILIFVNYLAGIEAITKQLSAANIEYVSMTGATRNRQQLVDQFQEDENCKAFVMTLKTGGTGLNLTAADRIFIFDPWWNAAAENQAIDRAHRIGQKNKVFAYKLITQNTIEEKMLKLQRMKKSLFDNIISTDSASIKMLSEDDIDFMLS